MCVCVIAFLKYITPTIVNELLFTRPKRYDICLHPSQGLDLHQFIIIILFISLIIHNINTFYHFWLIVR
jgi:hypothetical protein